MKIDCVFFQCLGSILIANISAGPPENPSWRCNMGEEQTEIYSKRGASGFLGRGLTWTGGDSTQYLTYAVLHFRLFQYQQQFQQHHRVRAKASTGWASPIPAEPQLCFPVCRYLCFRSFVFVLGFTVLYLNYTEISITRTCWTSLGCLPATGSVPPPHLPSKTKRWNILPSPKDPEKIELSSSIFFPVSLCSHSGKWAIIYFFPDWRDQRSGLNWLQRLVNVIVRAHYDAENIIIQNFNCIKSQWCIFSTVAVRMI